MTLLQLRILREIVRQSLNISAAARALGTSQPGISRQISLLEQELGIRLLIRHRNKVASLSSAGHAILAEAHSILNQIENIKLIANEDRGGGIGKLVIVTTHLHARYTILKPFQRLQAAYPRLQLFMFQAESGGIRKIVRDGVADIGLGTDYDRPIETAGVADLRGPVMKRCAIMLRGHPLAGRKKLRLSDFSEYPLVAISPQSRAGGLITETFRLHGVEPKIIVEAGDSDVIKAYVSDGLGIGIVPTMILNAKADANLSAIDVTPLFPVSRTNISIRGDMTVPRYLSDFIQMVAPGWTRNSIKAEMEQSTRHRP